MGRLRLTPSRCVAPASTFACRSHQHRIRSELLDEKEPWSQREHTVECSAQIRSNDVFLPISLTRPSTFPHQTSMACVLAGCATGVPAELPHRLYPVPTR